ncbi:MAG: transposase [Thermodesulfobacteriota bacterium]|nr:transposase [Thermodesulfobacteriota bacterium]
MEKDALLNILRRFSKLFFVEILGFCLLDNHFHLVVRILPGNTFSREEIEKRLHDHYGQDLELSDDQIPYFRDKLSSLANFMKEIKQTFSVYYNRRHHRRGTLWAERFKSLTLPIN